MERILLRTLPKDEIVYWEEQGKVEYFPFEGHPKGKAIVKGVDFFWNQEGKFYERNFEGGRR